MTTKLATLENGLVVATEAIPAVETAAVSLLLDAGARSERKGEHGLAHLFEHMVFKGTAKRSARAIAEAIEDVGGSLNAWTSRDSTCFHARVLARDVALAIDLIADLVLDARFDAGDLGLEREVVCSEIAEALDTPDDLVFDLLQEAAFPEQMLGRSVLGTRQSLDHLDPAALASWRQREYRAGSLVLAAAGKIDHDEITGLADGFLAKLARGKADSFDPARWVGGARLCEQDQEQLHVALGFQGFRPDDRRADAARLYATALGGGMSSRLFQKLREERGLAYTVSASHGMHADTGILTLYAGTRPEEGRAVLQGLRRIADETAEELTADELERARAQMKAGIIMGLEGCAGKADWLAGSFVTYGRVLSLEELIARLDGITLDETRQAGRAMLQSNPALAVVGPGADKLSL